MAYADAALVKVFINSQIVNNMLYIIMKCFILIRSVEPLSMRRINIIVLQVCQINFTCTVHVHIADAINILREVMYSTEFIFHL